jgi:hypothetical protein
VPATTYRALPRPRSAKDLVRRRAHSRSRQRQARDGRWDMARPGSRTSFSPQHAGHGLASPRTCGVSRDQRQRAQLRADVWPSFLDSKPDWAISLHGWPRRRAGQSPRALALLAPPFAGRGPNARGLPVRRNAMRPPSRVIGVKKDVAAVLRGWIGHG